ncbi:hypothetical protein QQ008_23895 [Fulvivirgaceae bacterium BMA10]|uniref:Long-chain fatty acid transport protein n=1 Tax=Splendidivirga corallicola TaxID=3051826 RepID=A0ABT8KUJ3_9BACT|nr:hypothetical protein [Fulvivirgaceae bacterium BMA10]
MCLKRYLLILLISIVYCGADAQISISPYTVHGIGDVHSSGLTNNIAMGGIGVSNGQNWYLNLINPALLVKNNFTVFEAGIVFEQRELTNNSDLSQKNSGGGLNYIALGFPVMAGRWSSSIGLMPYSTVNYNILENSSVVGNPDVPVAYNYVGDGGLTRAFYSNGVRIGKNFAVGVTASYLFGSIMKESNSAIGNSTTPVNYSSSIIERTSVSDFMFTTGAIYAQPISEKTAINFGVTYQLAADLSAKNFRRGELRAPTIIDPIVADTIVNNVDGTLGLPSSLAFGLSLEKTFKWTFGIDLHLNKWSEFKNFDGSSDGLKDNYVLNIGGEITPDITSVDSYFKRVTYRAGVNIERAPFEVNENQINDFGINFGASFPVKGISTMNWTFKFGQRGTTNDNLIKENYFRVYFGLTFNDRWFIRRKFD